MNRLALAFRTFWLSISNPETAGRLQEALAPRLEGPDLRVLAVLQRDGRLVDFLLEDIDTYTDSQVGAAVRDIHKGCRKALLEYVPVEAVLPGEEGEAVTIGADFDPASVRLLGNVGSNPPPFRGILKHHGWRVKESKLPALPIARDHRSILAPAEVELP